MVMKRALKVLRTIIVCAVVLLFTTCWVASEFVEWPQKQNYDEYDLAWLVLVVLAAIYTMWRILVFIIYQLSFTVTRAICEAKKDKAEG
jgi:uncharacterized membrane-anchored protein